MSRTRVPLSVAVTNAFALHRSPCRSVSGPPASFRTCALRASVEGLVAEILIDLPHTAALPLRRRRQQGGTALAQPHGREPAFGDQSVELRDRRLAALKDQGAWSGARLELQPVYATIELCQADRWHSSLGTAEECLQGLEQLSHTGLSTALQRVAKLCGVIDGQAHIATLDGPRVRPGP